MKAFGDVVIGDKIQYGASDLFRSVTDIEKVAALTGRPFSSCSTAWRASRLMLAIGSSASRRGAHEKA